MKVEMVKFRIPTESLTLRTTGMVSSSLASTLTEIQADKKKAKC